MEAKNGFEKKFFKLMNWPIFWINYKKCKEAQRHKSRDT